MAVSDITPAVGLYVHVPYCASLCGYCDFARVLAPGGEISPDFDEALLLEIESYREAPSIPLDTVYFGGGTPSLLPPGRLLRLLDQLREVFSLAPGAEVTLEANPETVSFKTAAAWRSAGINRLSVGVQSLDERELAMLDRRAGAAIAERAVRVAAESGFTRLSVDVMVGIPGQTEATLAATLDKVSTWPVDHLSAYLLDLHSGTRLHDRLLQGAISLPDEDQSADLYNLLCDHAQAAGFKQYELSNFARSGGESRHNLKYWRGMDTIGIGPAAHGCFRGARTANLRSTEAWGAALRAGSPPFELTSRITEEERLENGIIFGLRLAEGVQETLLHEFLAGCGKAPLSALEPLLAHGYMARTDSGRLRLTRTGFLASNEVLAYLLPEGWRAE